MTNPEHGQSPEQETHPQEIVDILARASHDTWMKQANRDKGIPMEQMDANIAPHDEERAKDAVDALREAGYKIVKIEE